MRRKSERNKAKGTPEKKTERPTRKSTRRTRGKASPSTSPEKDLADDNVSSTPYSDDEPEPKDQNEFHQDESKSISSSGLIKSVFGVGEENDGGSVWKVARADASPGEIQKLKLCRQRNTSETSDHSTSKKKSSKWPESGEVGAEEADSADEQSMFSMKTFISFKTDDPSSSHTGQDSIQEVSDCKETLTETTSANLSDDKPNIDQQSDNRECLPETSTLLPDQQSDSTNFQDTFQEGFPETSSSFVINESNKDNYSEITSTSLIDNQTSENANFSTDVNLINNSLSDNVNQSLYHESNTSENKTNQIPIISTVTDDVIRISNEISKDGTPSQKKPCLEENNLSAEVTEDNDSNVMAISTEYEEVDKELSNKEGKEQNDYSAQLRDESDTQDTVQTNHEDSPTPREKHKSRRKSHAKYESSSSDTPDSEEEVDKSFRSMDSKNSAKRTEQEGEIQSTKESFKSHDHNNEPELEITDNIIEKDDILEINEKSEDMSSISESKSTRVHVKRSYPSRSSLDSEDKEESVEKSHKNSIQEQENHTDTTQPDTQNIPKRRRWGMTSIVTEIIPAVSISTDSLKELVPEAKPLSVNEVRLTKDEDEEKEQRQSKTENGEHFKQDGSMQKSDHSKKDARRKIAAKEPVRRKSPVLELPSSNILLIKNLVRPFTAIQIKELLSRTGTIVENGFWMDRIKSKCFVEYLNEDQAFETRQALHGTSWPPSNPKKLIVEYSTPEDMKAAKESPQELTISRKTEPLHSSDNIWQQDWSRDGRNNAPNKMTIVREWDLGKEDGQISLKEKERERRELEKRRRQRTPDPEEHLPAPARKFKKKEEEPPTAKLLDDLFRKTKASPCIYWLPLTNEQIMVKEEMRRQHMEEHARRLNEIRRAERSRRGDSRRRRSPRK